MKKHAYLIMAHNQFDILEKLITLLDSEKNDIYLHIDRTVKSFDFEHFKKLVKKSNLFFTDRISVNWGGYSQIRCELLLLKAATKGDYSYYHSLSGVDLPLKSADDIYNFFENSNQTEFLTFCDHPHDENTAEKYKRYYPLQEHAKKSGAVFFIQRCLLKLQRMLNIDRTKNGNTEYYFGASWFSITDGFAKYLLGKEKEIEKNYKNTFCCDEIFMPTVFMQSPFKEKLSPGNFCKDYHCCARYIDWKRGTPYVFRKADYEDLISADYCFARKFDNRVDSEIIDMLYEHIKELNK